MGKIILPNTYVEKLEYPFIFLAGPIRDAPSWHDDAINTLFSLNKDVMIASPARRLDSALMKYVQPGNNEKFHRQREWERYHLEFASKDGGSIMFWLPSAAKHSCDKSYGAMTRKELGDWTTTKKFRPSTNLCIGTDNHFSEIHTLRYDISQDLPNLKIFSSLEETCKEAMRLATQDP
ncbi:MAG: hypothetical protein WCK90_00145 [archaeon]